MEKLVVLEYLIAAAIRLWLMVSDYNEFISKRVEISTPLNSWKRVKEGVALYEDGIKPYAGDLFHDTPLSLIIFSWLKKHPDYIDAVFILSDLITSYILYKIAQHYIANLYNDQREQRKKYKGKMEEALVKKDDIVKVPLYVLAVYLFNPYILLSCVARTTTVFHNLLLSIILLTCQKGRYFICCLALALSTVQTFYTFILIVPICLHIHGRYPFCISRIILPVITYLFFVSTLIYFFYSVIGDWSFMEGIYGFILDVPDLRPNIGLYWYFFTEMFEHFRSLFVWSFQINASILYLIPLSIRLRNEPILLASMLITIISIFKSYPSIGDIGFYLSLLPLWKHFFYYMQQGFLVTSFFVGCSIFAPSVWYLWIYCGSANANFFFGVTLAFATTQIFLITDLLFAHMKREYMMKHGELGTTDGKKDKLILE